MAGDSNAGTQHKEQQTERTGEPTGMPTISSDTRIGNALMQQPIPLPEEPTDNPSPLLDIGDKDFYAASQLSQSCIAQTVGLTNRLVLIRPDIQIPNRNAERLVTQTGVGEEGKGRSTPPLPTRVSDATSHPQLLCSPGPPMEEITDVQTPMLTVHNPNERMPTHHSQSVSSQVEERMQAVLTLLSLHQAGCADETQHLQEQLPETDSAIEPPTPTQSPLTLNGGAEISKPPSFGRTEAYSTLAIAHPQPDPELLPAQVPEALAGQPALSVLALTMNKAPQSEAPHYPEWQQRGCVAALTPSVILSEQRHATDHDHGLSQFAEAGSEDLSTRPLSAVVQPQKFSTQPELRRSSPCVAEPIAETPVPTPNNQSLNAQQGSQPILSDVPQTYEDTRARCRPPIDIGLDIRPDTFGTYLPCHEPIETRSASRISTLSTTQGTEVVGAGRPNANEAQSNWPPTPRSETMEFRDWLNLPNTSDESGEETDTPQPALGQEIAGVHPAEEVGSDRENRNQIALTKVASQHIRTSQVQHVAISTTLQYRQVINTLVSQ